MKQPIQPPIIIDETGATDVFETIAAAEAYMEAIDVENNRYSAFDSEGRLLRLQPTTPQVTIEAAEEVPSQANRLRQILIKFLRDSGVKEENLEILPLNQLVNKSLRFKSR